MGRHHTNRLVLRTVAAVTFGLPTLAHAQPHHTLVDPTPGAVHELEQHPGTGVRSAWLANGVRVHHRHVPGDAVLVTLHLRAPEPGPQNLMHARIAEEAVEALARDHNADVAGVASFVKRHELKVFARAAGDGLTISVRGKPASADAVMQTVHALLLHTRVPEHVVDSWRDRVRKILDGNKASGGLAQSLLLADVLGPERVWVPTLDEARNADANRIDRWTRSVLDNAPLEASIVGEIQWNRALDLAARYLGSLHQRPRLRHVRYHPPEPRKHPVFRKIQKPLKHDHALVLVGFQGPGWSDLRGLRTMFVAARLIEARMLSLEDQVPGAAVEGTSVWPGRGPGDPAVLLIHAKAPPDAATALARHVHAILISLSRDGPAADETAEAVRDIGGHLQSLRSEVRFWGPKLAEMNTLGLEPRDIADIHDAYASVTPADLQRLIADNATGAARFTLLVLPEAAPDN